jgi:hypothetical protein
MLLVIFGAGASYDSVQQMRPPNVPLSAQRPIPRQYPAHEEARPPLANQLFDTRDIFAKAMGQFPDCKALVPLLRRPDVSIERELARFQKQATLTRQHTGSSRRFDTTFSLHC